MADISKIQVPGSATQYNIKDAQARRDIEDVKADLGDQVGIISKIKNYYIKTSTTPVDLTPISSSIGRMYSIVDCSPGDKFVINAYSDSDPARAWCFIDSNNNIITMADKLVTVTDLELVAPANATKLIINDMRGGLCYKVGNNLASKVTNILSNDAKEALLNCFKHVAWIDKNGETYCDALAEALNFDDIYNTWVWDSSVGNITIVKGAYNTNQNVDDYPSRLNFDGPNKAQWERRRTITADKGRAPAYYSIGSGAIITGMSPYYPIPIPAKANHVKVTMAPSGQFMFMHTIQYQYADGVYGNSIEENRQTWTQLTNGVFEKDIINPGDLFLVTNFKYDSSGTSYPVEPSHIKIEFSEV